MAIPILVWLISNTSATISKMVNTGVTSVTTRVEAVPMVTVSDMNGMLG